jgi:hypothetical protein
MYLNNAASKHYSFDVFQVVFNGGSEPFGSRGAQPELLPSIGSLFHLSHNTIGLQFWHDHFNDELLSVYALS